ncbi:hypothetical protein KC19_3G064900 [Ceratodon purpureus]|uniref:Uncharacterized protein n=1 Tax=Ceratodon purpureus TaxID=3225 RepID=A0A8T0IFK3_CERPU|nr:hypothetical protein KC19_3G064900 [Ceratodon purpureus]
MVVFSTVISVQSTSLRSEDQGCKLVKLVVKGLFALGCVVDESMEMCCSLSFCMWSPWWRFKPGIWSRGLGYAAIGVYSEEFRCPAARLAFVELVLERFG